MYENYLPHEISFAREIAETLDDFDSLPYHLQQVRKYKEAFLRKILAQALSVPPEKVKKSRAALYVYLLNQSVRYGDARH